MNAEVPTPEEIPAPDNDINENDRTIATARRVVEGTTAIHHRYHAAANIDEAIHRILCTGNAGGPVRRQDLPNSRSFGRTGQIGHPKHQ